MCKCVFLHALTHHYHITNKPLKPLFRKGSWIIFTVDNKRDLRRSNMNTTPEQIQTEYTIPTFKVPEFQKKVKKLCKIAKATGNPAPSFELLDIFTKEYKTVLNIFGDERKYTVEFAKYKVDMLDTFKLPDDWKLIGIIDHIEGMVRTVPDQTIPDRYRGSENYCDHCKSRRNRKETFIVKDKNGNYAQIGRQCLIKYLGFDGDRLFKMLEWFSVAETDFGSTGDDEYDRWFSDNSIKQPFTISVDEIIMTTAHWLNNHGWVSGKTAYEHEGMASTASDVRYIMFPPYGYKEAMEGWEDFMEREVIKVTPDLKEALENKTTAIIEWAKTLDPKNDYLYNLKTIADNGECSFKYWGFAVSMVSAYDRAMGQMKEYAKKASAWTSNEFVGEPKERLDFVVSIDSYGMYEGMYGSGLRVNFKDEEGNALVWFSSNTFIMGNDAEQHLYELDLNPYMVQERFFDKSKADGTMFAITATVKKHSEFKGRKQTVLTRVKVIDGLTTLQECGAINETVSN